MDPWAPGTVIVFEANSHGPLARAPTLRRRRYRRRRKARFRRGRAHPSPGGSRTRWTADEVSWSHRIFQSSSTSSAWSHHAAYAPQAWGAPLAIAELNSDEESDVFLLAVGAELTTTATPGHRKISGYVVFSSDRSGAYLLYEASR